MGFFIIPLIVLGIGIIYSIAFRGFVSTCYSLLIGIPAGFVLSGGCGYLLMLIMAEFPPDNAGEYGIVLYFWWLVITTLGTITGFFVMLWLTREKQLKQKSKRY